MGRARAAGLSAAWAAWRAADSRMEPPAPAPRPAPRRALSSPAGAGTPAGGSRAPPASRAHAPRAPSPPPPGAAPLSHRLRRRSLGTCALGLGPARGAPARLPGAWPRSRCAPPPEAALPLCLVSSPRAPASLSSVTIPLGISPPRGPLRLSPASAPPPAHGVWERPRRHCRPRLPGSRGGGRGASVLRHRAAAAAPAAAARGPAGSPRPRP